MQHKTTHAPLLLLACFLLAEHLPAQNTRELFSRPGLAIGAYHFNFFDGSWNTSWRFAGDTIVCNDTLLVYEALTNTLSKSFLKIVAGKVFLQNANMLCNPGTLYYDFDLQLGQSFQLQLGGPLLQVAEKGQKTLLNGENRRYLRLTGIGWDIEWLEGVGDIGNGLLPAFYDFEGSDQFVCARDATGDLWQNPAESFKCDSLLCPVPIPRFSVNLNEKIATFSNTSLNGTSWLWEFGDGQSSPDQHPVHTYVDPGCYEVCLTAYTNCLQRSFRLCTPTPVCVDPAWEQRPQPPIAANTQYFSDIEFISPDTGWVLASRSIWKTMDGGQTWIQQIFPEAPAPTTRILQKIQMLDAQTGIIACGHYSGNGNEKAILITHDGGQTWEARADNSYFLSEAILTPDGQGFATGQFQELIYSNDGGDTWSVRNIPGTVELSWLQYMGGDTLYAFGYQGLPPQHTPAFIKTFNAGLSWQISLMPDYPVQYDAHFFNTQEGWALGKAGQLIHTEDAGQTWQPYFFGEMLKAQSIDFANEHVGWVVGEKGLVLHTTHSGFDWQRENCGYIGSMRNLSVAGANTAYANGNGPDLLAYHPGVMPNCAVSVSENLEAVKPLTLQLYPNPTDGYLGVQMKGKKPLQVDDKILIFNALGQLMFTQNCAGAYAGLDVSQLPKGCYVLVVLRNDTALMNGRFVKY